MSDTKHTPTLRQAMKWWRAQHPEYTDAKVRAHGWFGRAVFATHHYEVQVVASVNDVMDGYRAALAVETESLQLEGERYVEEQLAAAGRPA